jgi:hypothetical protein
VDGCRFGVGFQTPAVNNEPKSGGRRLKAAKERTRG